MSGTFQQINVPPMLMAFGITTVDARTVISDRPQGLTPVSHSLYAVGLPDARHGAAEVPHISTFVSSQIEAGKILSAWSVGFGGVEGSLRWLSATGIGAEVTMDEAKSHEYSYGLDPRRVTG